MAPAVEENIEHHVVDENAVVISGMSGLMPGCHNIMEFSDKLYSKENLVKKEEPRWKFTHPELCEEFYGNIPDLTKFDAQFFRVHYKLGQSMDPMSRILLEQTYQALFDAGVCLTELSRKRVGVFMALGIFETEKVHYASEVALGTVACSRAMYANRISYWLNVTGPSVVIDASCCSGLVALEKAYQAMLHGDCDAAIVGGSKILLHPQSYINYKRVIPINPDGKTKCYDMKADGQTQSEAINVLFLQKYKDARRIYASIRHVKTSFTVPSDKIIGEKYGPYRESASLTQFLHDFYNEAKILPSQVEFVEGFGAAVPEADKSELEAFEQVFCKNRIQPLLVGSVTSNMGCTETASGISGIIKLLIAYQKGELAANLHCETPRNDIAALRDARMKIITNHQSFNRSYTAINSISLTGINGHALLQGCYKKKDWSSYLSKIPYLVTLSGRQESSVQKILENLKSHQLDPEEIALLHNIHRMRISGHLARGFGIFSNETEQVQSLSETVDYYDDLRRPLWFVYSGMGSQWVGMGKHLLRIPIFAAAIERCQKALEPKGVDIIHILTSQDEKIYDNILNSFVGIAAIQIGLTDVLRAIGLVPDKIIGHSVGELGCAYADSCFTAEEMILAAYSRGLVSIQTPLICGSMAAVGMGYRQISTMCPAEIEVACHNGPNSSTISGPVDIMREFVSQLTARGIFAKEVPCSNIAYHSRYIAEAGPELLKYLSEVIKSPKPRSERWMSTSVPQDKWNDDVAKYSSAEYHTNNLLSPVLFEETSRLIPSNATLVEIAPHGLLQAILKRSLPPSCRHIPLTRRMHTDNALFLLEAIGRLYMEGYDVDLSVLYPKIEFPVSTETPSISHLVDWVHTEKWSICVYVSSDRTQAAIYKPIITVYDDEYQYLSGNIIEGKTIFPFAGALIAVWDLLAMSINKTPRKLSVYFHDVHLYTQPIIQDLHALHLTVSLQRGSGRFEVTYEHGLICDGYVVAASRIHASYPNLDECDSVKMSSSDIYKLLQEKGYEYTGEFRSIHRSTVNLTHAQLLWRNNWVTLVDGMLQLMTLRRAHNAISQPIYITHLDINVKKHLGLYEKNCNINELPVFDAVVYDQYNAIKCGGVTIEHITFKDKPSSLKQFIEKKTLKFIPFFANEEKEDTLPLSTSLYNCMQIVDENLNKSVLTVFDISNVNIPSEFDKINDLLKSPPEIKFISIKMNVKELLKNKCTPDKPDLVILYDTLHNKEIFESLYQILPEDIFIISIEDPNEKFSSATVYRPVLMRETRSKKIILSRWRPFSSLPMAAKVSVKTHSDLAQLRKILADLPSQRNLLILSTYPPPHGLKDLVKKWRKESNHKQIFVSMINETNLKHQDMECLANFDLAYNVLNNGTWGNEYYVPLIDDFENNTTQSIIKLQSAQHGDIDSLHWTKTDVINELGIGVTVYYAGLNVCDAKRATAELSVTKYSYEGYGMDFSGITDNGDRVMGLIEGGAACGRVRARPELLWPVPAHWSLEDAATVPLPYAHAFYCLAIKCNLLKGKNILVHGGAGALGQAAISIALAVGCEVFTTVSDIYKKQLLRKIFPELKDDHIGNSRDSSFGDMVLTATKGYGCDIVISCVKAELKNTSLRCCAPCGITFDTEQILNQENYTFGMHYMNLDRSYVQLDFSSIFANHNVEEMKKLQLMMSEGIKLGYVRPLTRVTFPPCDAPRAFRLLSTSEHCGRVLLHLQDAALSIQPRLICSPHCSQLLICDKENFGLQLADRLVNRGARKLYLHCSSLSGYLYFKKCSWEKFGVKVQISSESLNEEQSIISLLEDGNLLGSIEAIYIINTASSHSNVSKTNVTSLIMNLDLVSRKLCPSLKYFVVINDDFDLGKQVCVNRVRNNLPSLSILLHNIEQFDVVKKTSKKTDGHNNTLKWFGAIDTIEKTMLGKEVDVILFAQASPQHTIVKEIFGTSGFKNKDIISDASTLEQLGVDRGHAQELCNFLEKKFNIVLSKETVLQMTIDKLKELEREFTNIHKKLSGFVAYFNYIDLDELLASAEIILMQTLVQGSERRSGEFDINKTYLCIVPGLEGHYGKFRVFCERLKMPAVVLQLGFDILHESVHEMAQRLVNVITKKLKIKDHFYILGYEFGVLVAMEMAAILEKDGLSGTIYCLGGTPDEMLTVLKTDLNDTNTGALQDILLQHMCSLMTENAYEKLDHKIQKAQNWKEKVEICLQVLRGRVPYTLQYTRAVLETAYSRIKAAFTYTLKTYRLRSKIVIMRANLPIVEQRDMLNFSHQPIARYQLQADLPYTPDDLRCATIINEHLEPELLDKFNNINHCETYLLNDDLFLKYSLDNDN